MVAGVLVSVLAGTAGVLLITQGQGSPQARTELTAPQRSASAAGPDGSPGPVGVLGDAVSAQGADGASAVSPSGAAGRGALGPAALASIGPGGSGPGTANGQNGVQNGTQNGTGAGTQAGGSAANGTGTSAGGGSAGGSGGSGGGSGTGTNQPANPPAVSGSSQRGFLYAIARPLSAAEADALPATYGVVVLNQWQADLARRIKAVDPSVVVLMYQCLASTRSSDDPTHRSGGVLYSAAPASWFATDGSGNRVGWGPYAGHWQMAVWDSGYQDAWVDTVVRDVTAGPWDGVLADNDMSTLKWYSSAVLAGTSSSAATDAKLRDALGALIAKAGPALNARGKVLVPNISDARDYPGRWASHARFGGGMEEVWAHFGSNTGGDWIYDWGARGWQDQTTQAAGPGLSLLITPAASGDTRTLLYGYASALVRGSTSAYWMPAKDGSYTGLVTIPELSYPIGEPKGAAVRQANGAWTRSFASAWVAVNPTLSTVTVSGPSGSVTLAPASGAVVRTS